MHWHVIIAFLDHRCLLSQLIQILKIQIEHLCYFLLFTFEAKFLQKFLKTILFQLWHYSSDFLRIHFVGKFWSSWRSWRIFSVYSIMFRFNLIDYRNSNRKLRSEGLILAIVLVKNKSRHENRQIEQ